MKRFTKASALLLLIGLSGTTSTFAKDNEHVAEPSRKTDYRFRQPETPKTILPYNTIVYTCGNTKVATMRGDCLIALKDSIDHFALNPSAANFVTVAHNKKGKSNLSVFSTSDVDKKMFNLDTKKYGVPTSAVYTPEAKRMAVATDKGIFIFETRKFNLIGQIDLVPVKPTDMVMSPNGYYLALTEGSKVVVYNFEDRNIRKRWDFEVAVTEVSFSNDSQMMGVLTDDGLLTIYDTRRFDVRTTVDDLGDGLAFSFNDNGKYIAVATSPDTIQIINLLKQADRETITIDDANLADLCFTKDSFDNTVLIYGSLYSVLAKRLFNLEPYYAKLVSDEVDLKMVEWMKMQPGESMEDYKNRISDENQRRQRRLYEDEISTSLAGDLLSMNAMSFGKYNTEKELLEIDFTNMPAIYLPVSRTDITSFHDAGDVDVSEVQYGLLPDDSFEMIYARFLNKNDGKTYIYDNVERVPMTFLDGDDNIVSLEVLQQQQLEEMKLQELKERVIREAQSRNVISNHTNITVDSRVTPDYNANGDKILNYIVKFTYQVEPEFSAVEDFPPGKYKSDESGAASSMLSIVKQAFEGDLAQHLGKGKKMLVNISGTADATPILRGIPYDGCYGDFEEEPIRQNGELTNITVTKAGGITTNEQLAFLRAAGVKDNLERNVEAFKDMDTDYRYNISVSQDKGSEHRRITAEFTIFDVF